MRGRALIAATCVAIPALAWVQDAPEPAKLVVTPETIEMRVGESVQIDAKVYDAEGGELDVPILYLPLRGQFWNLEHRTWGFNIFRVRDGLVAASRPGEYAVMVRVPKDPEARGPDAEAFLQQEIPLTILPPPASRVEIANAPEAYYAGTRVRLDARAFDSDGERLREATLAFDSDRDDVAAVSATGGLELRAPGAATITVGTAGASTTLAVAVVDNPVDALELVPSARVGRTGDVIHFEARLSDASGRRLDDVPVTYSFFGNTDPMSSGGPSSGLIRQDGRFVADLPGSYTVVATAGSRSDAVSVTIGPRAVQREVRLVGHGRVKDRATSDLWIWEGPDGRDYAITGTHSASGHAYIWDVTDPAAMEIIDTVRVDARTVNDVKISEDGRIAVISREGASNRRNGIVVLDVSEPARRRAGPVELRR